MASFLMISMLILLMLFLSPAKHGRHIGIIITPAAASSSSS